jgi:hypothetical protein
MSPGRFGAKSPRLGGRLSEQCERGMGFFDRLARLFRNRFAEDVMYFGLTVVWPEADDEIG